MFKTVRRFIGKAFTAAKSFGKTVKPQGTIAFKESQSKYSPGVQSMLNQYGNGIVTNIRVCREIVPKNTEMLLNIASLGKWNEAKKVYGFDNFFHLFMTFDVNGKRLMLEKNQIMNLSAYPRACEDSMEVSPGGTFTLNQMMENGRKYMGDSHFFPYDALKNNCQNFILGIIKGNHLSNPPLDKFIYQDIGEMAKSLPSYIGSIANAFTNVAAAVDTGLQKKVASIGEQDGQGAQGTQGNEGIQGAEGE